jgi:hypothetical protein
MSTLALTIEVRPSLISEVLSGLRKLVCRSAMLSSETGSVARGTGTRSDTEKIPT